MKAEYLIDQIRSNGNTGVGAKVPYRYMFQISFSASVDNPSYSAAPELDQVSDDRCRPTILLFFSAVEKRLKYLYLVTSVYPRRKVYGK